MRRIMVRCSAVLICPLKG